MVGTEGKGGKDEGKLMKVMEERGLEKRNVKGRGRRGGVAGREGRGRKSE